MGFVRSIFAAGVAALAGLALKKLIGSMEKQAEAARVKREDARDATEFKKLKQDPNTGVYYAED
jgi:hypothetical protein